MKKIYIAPLLLLVTAFAIAGVMNDSGKAGRTGSPGEFDCTGCHTSFAVNSGPGSISISSPNLTNWEYVLGQTYQIEVTVSHTGMPVFGLGFEALRISNNTNGGTLVITNSVETQIRNATINGSSRANVVHKKDGGLTPNTHTFSFDWTAPSTNIGNVIFYAAGNAGDDQGDSLNDYVYTTVQTVIPFTTGISENIANASINVFPNPVHECINISLQNASSTLNAILFDNTGRIILNENRKEVAAKTPLKILLPENLHNGIYFLKTTDENNKSATVKIFVYN